MVLFLACALALPANANGQYSLLKNFLEKRYPDYTIVFVNEEERLVSKNAVPTPLSVTGNPNLRLWMIKRGETCG